MTSTSKRILYGTVTFGLVLLLFQFQLPVETTMTVVGIAGVVFGLLSLVMALLVKRGKLQLGSWWGRSAIEIFWQGIGILALGLGQLSHLIVASDLALKLRTVAGLVLIAAIFVGRSRAKVAEESKIQATPVA